MKACPSTSRSFVLLFILSACGASEDQQNLVLTSGAHIALSEPDGSDERLSEPSALCLELREQITALDEAIETLPQVRAVRDAYEASELGRREIAASRAWVAEGCFSDGAGTLSGRCVAFMDEVETCASYFENSPEFQRILALPQMQAFDALSERFANLCAASMPDIDTGDCADFCDDAYGDLNNDGCAGEEDHANLPTTV